MNKLVVNKIWQSPEYLLLAMTFVMSFGFSGWQVLLNNFVVEQAGFTGVEIGILQSLREIPGFLAFTAVFVLLILKEQTMAYVFLLVMCLGISLTGFFPHEYGLYFTTILMSIGFHYYETINKSLSLQWIAKSDAPHFFGKALSVKAIASLSVYASVWIGMQVLGVTFKWMYFFIGSFGLVAVLIFIRNFKPHRAITCSA